MTQRRRRKVLEYERFNTNTDRGNDRYANPLFKDDKLEMPEIMTLKGAHDHTTVYSLGCEAGAIVICSNMLWSDPMKGITLDGIRYRRATMRSCEH